MFDAACLLKHISLFVILKTRILARCMQANNMCAWNRNVVRWTSMTTSTVTSGN
jgi:hypothetical protein